MAIILEQFTTVSTLVLLLVVLLLYSAIRRLYNGYFHLHQFPGPKWAAFTRFWLLRTYASTNSANIFMDTNKRYGKHRHNRLNALKILLV